MEPENIATNLRLLADKSRREAEFFELAANLHEQGYQTDKATIDAEVQKVKEEKDAIILNQAGQISALTVENENLKK